MKSTGGMLGDMKYGLPFPESLNDLIDELLRFPGIGRKTATDGTY